MEANEKNYPNRRKPWHAVFLTLVMPGLGHVYCGCIVSGFIIMAVMSLMTAAFAIGILLQSSLFSLLNLLIWGLGFLPGILFAIDAYRRARRTRYDYIKKDYNHWAIYLTLFLIGGTGNLLLAAGIKQNLCSAYHIAGNSMAPTIMFGDRAIAGKMAYRRTDPERGDIVLHKKPGNRKVNFIERVVALGGDTIEVKNGKLIINGKPLKTEWVEKKIMMAEKEVEGDIFWETNGNARYQIFISKQDPQKGDFGPVKVPPYHCFVMGDNRNQSRDSRDYGALSIGEIEGKFWSIYWPYQRRASLDAKK